MTVYCRYLNRVSDQCTGEAVDPDGEVLLCSKHLAAATELVRRRLEAVGLAGTTLFPLPKPKR